MTAANHHIASSHGRARAKHPRPRDVRFSLVMAEI